MSLRPPESRVPAADVLRALCCLVVVLLHAFIAAETQPDLDRSYEMWGLIGYQLSLWATPLFAVLSGFVIFHSNREFGSPSAFWRRRLAVVAIPFLVWSCVYWLVNPEGGHLGKVVLGALLGLLGQRHLYFVAMILQFYAVFPLIAAGCRRAPVRRLLAPALLLTLAHLTFFSYVPAPNGALSVLWEFSDALLPGWLFYLLLGAALAEAPDVMLGFVRRRPSVAVGLLAAGTALLLGEYLLAPLGPRDFGSRRPIVVAYATMALPLLWLISERIAALPVYRWARTLAAYSFAVYLFHPMALHLVRITTPVPTDLTARIVIYCIGCAALTSAAIALALRLPFGALILGLPKRPAGVAAVPEGRQTVVRTRRSRTHAMNGLATGRE